MSPGSTPRKQIGRASHHRTMPAWLSTAAAMTDISSGIGTPRLPSRSAAKMPMYVKLWTKSWSVSTASSRPMGSENASVARHASETADCSKATTHFEGLRLPYLLSPLGATAPASRGRSGRDQSPADAAVEVGPLTAHDLRVRRAVGIPVRGAIDGVESFGAPADFPKHVAKTIRWSGFTAHQSARPSNPRRRKRAVWARRQREASSEGSGLIMSSSRASPGSFICPRS
jgi:hypothetical protein